MVNYPIIEHLDIERYGLFGTAPEHVLKVIVDRGITLVLGGNGLGKTTIVSMLYRLLAGPTDVTALQYRLDLGTARLDSSRITPDARALFARRVADGARTATATMTVRFADNNLVVQRNLGDLRLVALRLNSDELDISEDVFQREIVRLVGVPTFGDWILILRYLTFFMEDRRPLIWDATAQRQVLRVLFLPQETSAKWLTDERDILELDTRMRNLRAVLSREERAVAVGQAKTQSAAKVLEELKSLAEQQQLDREKRERLAAEGLSGEAAREDARLRTLRAEDDREERYRQVERIKLESIAAAFPTPSETARYLLAQLMAEGSCLVCGNVVPDVAADLELRAKQGKCVVCGSDVQIGSTRVADPVVVTTALRDLEAAEETLAEARLAQTECENNYREVIQQITQLNAAIAKRSTRIDWLVAQLPPDEQSLHKQRSELSLLRTRVEELKVELAAKKNLFRGFIDGVNQTIVESAAAIKKSFDGFAQGFLLDQCKLVWSPKKSQVGQEAGTVEFPAFELEMSGTDFLSPVRRTGPEQVSESQREFIDLSFRMALMTVSGFKSHASLVIDTPESSLDAVFAPRAAQVLTRFAHRGRNRVIVTSNLVEGALIPGLVFGDKPSSRQATVVDLFELAAPTAAVKALGTEYKAIRNKLLTRKTIS